MRVRSMWPRRRSVTAPGTIVTDMDTFRYLKAADHARLSTVVSEGNCGSDATRQPTNRSLMPLSDDGERHEQERTYLALFIALISSVTAASDVLISPWKNLVTTSS